MKTEMTPHEIHQANVKRLSLQLIAIVEREDIADAGAALCEALATVAFRNDFALESLLFMTRDSIKQRWRKLKNSTAQQSNEEIKEEEGNGKT